MQVRPLPHRRLNYNDMEKLNIYTLLSGIQASLKAPKSQYNAYGKYRYRSAEDILNALKPMLKEAGLVLLLSDDIFEVAGRVYVRSTAKLTDGDATITNTAFAREDQERKGMDGAQITGSASSYARKYALNGMFCIDDVKDSDFTNTGQTKQANHEHAERIALLKQEVLSARTVEGLQIVWQQSADMQKDPDFINIVKARKKELQDGTNAA